MNFDFEYISFSSGGTKGLLFVGALEALERRFNSNGLCFTEYCRMNVKGFSGCSAGAFIALGLNLGLDLASLKEVINPILESARNVAPCPNLGLFINNFGLDDGSSLKELIESMLKRAGLSEHTTLSDLNRLLRREFVCVVSNLKTYEPVYLNAKTHPKMLVSEAVFTSMCVPLLFKPQIINEEFYVDGGLTDSLANCFPDTDKVLFIVAHQDPPRNVNIKSWFDYVQALFLTTGMQNYLRDKKFLQTCKYKIHLNIPECFDDFSLNMDMSKYTMIMYMHSGYASVLRVMVKDFEKVLHQIFLLVISLQISASTNDEQLDSFDEVCFEGDQCT